MYSQEPPHRPKKNKNVLGCGKYLIIAMVIMVPLFFLLQSHIPLNFIIYSPFVTSLLGTIVLVIGILSYIYTLRFFRKIIEVKLVTDGPFRHVRHPLYASILLLIVPGLILLSQSIWAIIMWIGLLIVFYVTIGKEERELIALFGEDYEEYKNKVPLLFPFKKN